MTTSLVIKDGDGTVRSVTVESGSYGYIPVHTQTVVTTVTQTSASSFSWATAASGSFSIAAASTTRKGLSIFNPGPYDLYIALSTAGGTTNGFVLTSTASAPTYYSFILYPSGTFIADPTNVGVTFGGYFLSGAASTGVFVTSIA